MKWIMSFFDHRVKAYLRLRVSVRQCTQRKIIYPEGRYYFTAAGKRAQWLICVFHNCVGEENLGTRYRILSTIIANTLYAPQFIFCILLTRFPPGGPSTSRICPHPHRRLDPIPPAGGHPILIFHRSVVGTTLIMVT